MFRCCFNKKLITQQKKLLPMLLPKTFNYFTMLPLELQQYISSYCHRTHELRATNRIIREFIPPRPPRRTVERYNFGFAVYHRWIDGPWESEMALSTIMSELSHYLKVTIFSHPHHLVHHMIVNDAHSQTIQHVRNMMKNYNSNNIVTFLPIHSQRDNVYHYIYRYRTSFEYL